MNENEKSYVFSVTIPPEVSKARIQSDLDELSSGLFDVSIVSSHNETSDKKLGQIDPTTIELILLILDTKASAAAVQTTLGAVIGYIFAKTGRKPDKKDPD